MKKAMKQEKPKYELAYICNGKNPKCRGKNGCFYGPAIGGIKGSCSHTLDPKYSLNGAIKDHPRNHPERFDRVSVGNQVRYYEKYGYGE